MHTHTYSKEKRLEEMHPKLNIDRAGIAIVYIGSLFICISKNFHNKQIMLCNVKGNRLS